MTMETMIANLGGMMGLCMGLSLVSVLEILYFLLSATLLFLKQGKVSKNKVLGLG
jgi:hypothetical protein